MQPVEAPNVPSDSRRDGWSARLSLAFCTAAGRTRMLRRGGHGPLYVQKPFYPEGSVCHLYLLHPPGGVVGGDSLAIELDVQSQAHALFTTPAATKFMRSAGQQAVQGQTLTLSRDASAEWLPQENILFSGAIARNQTTVRLQPGARFVGWDICVFGRPAVGEHFAAGRFDSLLSVERWDDALELYRPVFIDRQQFIGGGPEFEREWGLGGHPVLGTMVVAPADADLLGVLRQRIGSQTAVGACEQQATLVRDVLVVRCRGRSSSAVQDALRQTWAWLRPLVFQRTPLPPAIWRT